MTEEETKPPLDAAIAQWHADYHEAIMQWQADYKGLFELLLNPSMSRREKKRWDKAQRKKAKGKK
jgi:hypothetical protein